MALDVNVLMMGSLLDRLVAPGGEAGSYRGQSVQAMKQSVRRDLENLLNTRCRSRPWPPVLNDELQYSLQGYGLPDITGLDLGDAREREKFRRRVERTICDFEPRLRAIRVSLAPPEPLQRVLRMRIEATMLADPIPKDVSFDTAVDPTTSSVSVDGGDR